MIYSEEFIEYAKTCKKHNNFIGIGNPSAPILIISNDIKTDLIAVDKDWYYKNNEYWSENIQNKKQRNEIGLEIFPPKRSPLNKKQHRWNTYQKFHDCLFKEDLTILNNIDIPLWFYDYFIFETVEEMRLEFTSGEKSLKLLNEYRIDFLERIFIIELPSEEIQNIIFKTKYIQSFSILILDGNLLRKEEIERSFAQESGGCRYSGYWYDVAKSVKIYESMPFRDRIFIIDDLQTLTEKNSQLLAYLIRFFLWDKNSPIIDGHILTTKFIRKNGFKTPNGISIPATTKIMMNFEGLTSYKTETLDVISIPNEYFQKEWTGTILPDPIPSNYVMEIKDDTLKFKIIKQLSRSDVSLDSKYAFNNIDIVDNTIITYSDLQKIKAIDDSIMNIFEKPISDISILKYCHNIEDIEFCDMRSSFRSLEPIKNAKKIKKCILKDFLLDDININIVKEWHSLEEFKMYDFSGNIKHVIP